MKQLKLYKEALRLLRDSEVSSHLVQFRIKHFSYGFLHFSGLCKLMEFLIYENFLNDNMIDIFKSQSEDILGKELNWQSFWFTPLHIDKELAKQERVEHLEKLIEYYDSKGW